MASSASSVRSGLGRTIASIVLAASILIGTVGIGQAAPARAPLTKVSIVLKWVTQAQFAGFFVAQKKGYYADEGLDVTIIPGGPTVLPEQLVEKGTATFGLDWLPSLLAQRESGSDLVNIAQFFQTTGMRLIAFKTTGIKSPKDFRGKKIGVWQFGNQYQFLAWMNKLRYNPDKDMTVIHQGFEMNTFLAHKMDMASAMTYNELGVVLESGVKLSDLVVFDYGKEGVSMLEDGMYARGDYLKAHPGIAVKFLKASILGWQDVVKDPAGAAKIVVDADQTGQTKLPHQVYMAKEVVKLLWWGPAKTHGIGYMDPAAFLRTAKESVAYGDIKKMPSGAYDQSYWKEATKELAAKHQLMIAMGGM